VLALEDSALDVDQVENLIKFCPTKEEIELLKVWANYYVVIGVIFYHLISFCKYFIAFEGARSLKMILALVLFNYNCVYVFVFRATQDKRKS
jgi:hypothetical protein